MDLAALELDLVAGRTEGIGDGLMGESRMSKRVESFHMHINHDTPATRPFAKTVGRRTGVTVQTF